MSKVGLTGYTRQFRGRFGDIVFRERDGMSIAALPPRNAGRSNTTAQKSHRDKFRKAVGYAQSALADPTMRTAYDAAGLEKRKQPFALAVGDYFKPPMIHEIIVAEYKGKVGDAIAVIATDDIGVTGVTVTIRTAAGAVIEQGDATLTYGKWLYHGTTALAHGQNVKIQAAAKDRPGNITNEEVAYLAP